MSISFSPLKKFNVVKSSGMLSTRKLHKKALQAEQLMQLVEAHNGSSSTDDRFKKCEFKINDKHIYICIQTHPKHWLDNETKTKKTASINIQYSNLTAEQAHSLREIVKDAVKNDMYKNNPSVMGLVLCSIQGYLQEQMHANTAAGDSANDTFNSNNINNSLDNDRFDNDNIFS